MGHLRNHMNLSEKQKQYSLDIVLTEV